MDVRADSPGVFRGPRLQSRAEVEALLAMGIKTIISLQSDLWEFDDVSLEALWAARVGVVFMHEPMGLILPPRPSQLRRAVAMIQNAKEYGPVYVHCHDGVDRTGAVMWAYDVWSRQMSFELSRMMKYGFHVWRYFWWLPFLSCAIRLGRGTGEASTTEHL